MDRCIRHHCGHYPSSGINQHVEEEQFKNFATKNEDDLSFLYQCPFLHQQIKLLTFCTNTRPFYCLDQNSWEPQLPSCTNLTTSGPTPSSYLSHMTVHSARLHNTICRLYNNNQDCCTVCFWLCDILHSSYFNVLADTILWPKEHPMKLQWHESTLAPNSLHTCVQLHSEPFSHQLWSSCSNTLTYFLPVSGKCSYGNVVMHVHRTPPRTMGCV